MARASLMRGSGTPKADHNHRAGRIESAGACGPEQRVPGQQEGAEHPAYPARHAKISGACFNVLKQLNRCSSEDRKNWGLGKENGNPKVAVFVAR
jgi:hypothetical protein